MAPENGDQIQGAGAPADNGDLSRVAIPPELPIIALDDIVVYPYAVLPLTISDEPSVRAINDAVVKGRMIGLVAKAPAPGKPGAAKAPAPVIAPPAETEAEVAVATAPTPPLRVMGCAASVLKLLRLPDGGVRILAQGVSRVRLGDILRTEPYVVCRVERVDSVDDDTKQTNALARGVVQQFQKMVSLSPHLPDEFAVMVLNIDDRSRLADVVATTLQIDIEERQRLLETIFVRDRLRRINELLSREIELLELSSKIQSQVKSEVDKSQREYFLRQQLKAIQDELGEGDERTAELKELRQRIEEAKLPKEAREEAERELDRLSRMPPAAAEYTVARTYLDWMLAMPWHKQTRDHLDVNRAAGTLDEDHFDLEKVKGRILEFLAVRRLKNDSKGPILCFVGPPGTGKTSLGRSIARAMGRKFVRISLGGVHDEAEIRGHRRTYVGALPGRIIQSIRKAGSRNPVFMLDEVDKLGADFHGDPSSALLEVLDPEQNNTFTDHYLDVPFDLRGVMFITTANVLDTIPPPLRDRMEILELPGYPLEEKVTIAQRYLIPRQLAENGLAGYRLEFPPETIKAIINDYTRESGLRNLEREIANICRKVATEVLRQNQKVTRASLKRMKKHVVAIDDLREMLGPQRFFREVAQRTSEPGVATGLAWTPVGGEIIFVEAVRMRGSNRLTLTGQLGDVMKESAEAALSYVRARCTDFGIPHETFKSKDIHIHVPAGAVRKDGPSAGVTMAMALLSLHSGHSIRPDVAMTGEISLRGYVLGVGGIKEKLLAAHRAGIRTVILPKQNQGDLAEIPRHVLDDLDVRLVDRIDEAAAIAFGGKLPIKKRRAAKKRKSGATTKAKKKARRKK